MISIIIPAYNAEKYLANTIQSVINQTFTDWELIIINDGSTDGTLELINNFKDKDSRIKVFSHENAGVAHSRNRGIAEAKGEFIAFLDADDLWTIDKLEIQLKALQENSYASVAYSWVDYIDEAGKFLYPGSHITVNGDAYPKLLINNFLENGSNPLVRREALAKVGDFDVNLPPAEDWDLYLRLAREYEFVAIPRPQILYRLCTNSCSANITKMETQALRVIEKAYNQTPESLQYLKRETLAKLYEYLLFRTLESNPQRQQFWKAGKYFAKMFGYDPTIVLRRTRLMLIVLVKILLGLIF